MKLTKTKLKQLIKEEIGKTSEEYKLGGGRWRKRLQDYFDKDKAIGYDGISNNIFSYLGDDINCLKKLWDKEHIL